MFQKRKTGKGIQISDFNFQIVFSQMCFVSVFLQSARSQEIIDD